MTTSDDRIQLSSAFDKVLVTPGEAATILSALASDLRDSSPSVHAALVAGADELLNPPVRSTTTTSSTPAKSSTSST